MSKMPVLFIGHGSPMNAIDDNKFTQTLSTLGQNLPEPKAILCISAHWMTKGTWVTQMQNPKTIHDFYGFPPELFAVNYPAPGNPELAAHIRKEIRQPEIGGDVAQWGLDHGTWSVLRHIYPKANIPIVQLSLNLAEPGEYHFKLGEQLRKLRSEGVLIIGSGNIVHNLRKISWDPLAKPVDWAVEFDEWVKEKLLQRDYTPLVNNATDTLAGQLSVPTPDHYYPFLYTLGAADKNDQIKFEFEGMQNASISMRCVSFTSD